MTIIDPGCLFLKTYGQVESEEDVLAYAEFLRRESGINGMIPVNLNLIFLHFQIPDPIQKPLPGQQGLLVDAANGIILINANDPPDRQKFSQAHELVELLFNALPNGKDLGGGWFLKKPGGFKETTKEYLCNRTAANLLMPPDYVRHQIKRYGTSFECARVISAECEISLSAALVQIAHLSSKNHTVVLWVLKNKPSEIKNKISNDQPGVKSHKVVYQNLNKSLKKLYHLTAEQKQKQDGYNEPKRTNYNTGRTSDDRRAGDSRAK